VKPTRGACKDGDRHVVLIGRPEAGPARIGRHLSRLLQRPFAATDEQIELIAGRTLARLARERGEDDLRRWGAEVLADLLASDVALVISAAGAIDMSQGNQEVLARSAVVLWTRAREDGLAQPDYRLAGVYEDIADHVVDVEPFRTSDQDPERAIARHMLQLLVAGDLRGSVRVQNRDSLLADGRDCDDLQAALTKLDHELQPHLEDIADHIIDVDQFDADNDDLARAIARHIARLLAHDDARPADPA
jgi:Shikimate kinase